MLSANKMPFHYAVMFRIYPTRKQARIIAKNDGVSRKTYNNLVAYNKERYALSKTAPYSAADRERLEFLDKILSSKADMLVMMPFAKDSEVDSLAIDNAYVNYNSAWNMFRKNPQSAPPTFHKKGATLSYKTNSHLRLGATAWDESNTYFYDNGKKLPCYISLPILGKTRFKGSPQIVERVLNHRENTRIGSISIKRDACGDYFVSLQFHSMTPFVKILPATGKEIGIDMNLSNFYTDSNNNVVENPKYKRNIQKKLAKAQRILSRRCCQAKKENRDLNASKNYQEQRIKVAKLNRLCARQREDFLHVEAKRLIDNQDFIVSEDLKVKNLLKNHNLAYAIADVSWSEFFTFLAQKATMYGRVYIKVPAKYTTQTCSDCGYVMKGDEHIQLGASEWICPSCGVRHIRDYNAAVNILKRGLTQVKP